MADNQGVGELDTSSDAGREGGPSGRPAPGELNNSIIGALVAHVRDEHGEGALREVLARAGERRSLDELCDATRWSSNAEVRSVIDAAREVTGDDDLARRAGERLVSAYADSEVVAVLRAIGDVGGVLRVVADVAGKQATMAGLECLEVGERSARISCRVDGGWEDRPETCQYAAGVLAAVPTIFGMAPATVTEEQCQLSGAQACILQVQWDPSSAGDPAVEAAYVGARLGAQTRRFVALEETARRLAGLSDVDEALRVVTEQAASAVRAPAYVLVARLPGDVADRVHAVGIPDAEVPRLAEEILRGPADGPDESRLVVDLASGGRRFGRLAAVYPSEHRFLDGERRLLAAYAGHGAAALVQAAALAEAREQTATLGTLLDLAQFLGEVRSLQEVAEHVAVAAAALGGAERAAVLVWEPDDGLLVRRGTAGGAGRGAERWWARTLPPSVVLPPDLADELAASGEVAVLGADGPEHFRAVASAAGVDGGLLVPMAAAGSLLGVIVAGAHRTGSAPLPEPAPAPGGSGVVARRLVGLAGLASTALSNARLLDRIRHQAEHDPLTGLPNLRLVDRLAEVGLAEARRRDMPAAVLFVDLDRFKPVNDRLGHAAGDRLLVEAADRLRAVVRGADTVGRVGGDEFVVVLTQIGHLGGAMAVAERIVRSFDTPFVLDGAEVRVGATVGVALSHDDDTSLAGLLARADAAMYRAKNECRGAIGIDGGGVVRPQRRPGTVGRG